MRIILLSFLMFILYIQSLESMRLIRFRRGSQGNTHKLCAHELDQPCLLSWPAAWSKATHARTTRAARAPRGLEGAIESEVNNYTVTERKKERESIGVETGQLII